MILIGLYDSPFVRRVAIALRLYGLAYEHRAWSVWNDADKIAPYNPLLRVPTLILDDGEVLTDSAAILDHLDQVVGPSRAMIAASGPQRRHALRICALACGTMDKAVSWLVERLHHAQVSDRWVARCHAQVTSALTVLEQDRSSTRTPYWFGDAVGHADVAVACAIRLTREAHSGVFDNTAFPALAAHAARCEALPVFREISLPLYAPEQKS